jgi:hypothetical protein
MQLPSNKIATLFILVVLIVVLVISGDVVLEKIGIGGNGQPELVDGNLYLERQTTDEASVDPDKDGLLDWQELLYKSNPQIADTDGDGTNDGDEIKEGRDPSIAGPNDKLIKFADLLDTDFNVDYKPDSLTGNLSVELLANYLNMKKSDVYDAESSDILTNDLANKANMSSEVNDIFTNSQIKKVQTNKETLIKYGNEFANIQINYANQMRAVTETDDFKYVAEVASKYKKMAQALSLIDVPDNLGSVHLQIINKLYNTGVLFEEINNYNSDPVKSLFAIKKMKENSKGQTELYQSLANYFRDNGIIFTDNNIISFWNLYK